MLGLIFPKQIDNNYHGHWLAIWLLVPVALLKTIMGTNSIINTRSVLTGADGIPLDDYGAEAAQTVVSMFALLGVGNLVLALLSFIALIRYRAMIPLIFLVLLIEHASRRALIAMNPIVRPEGTPVGFYINMTILALLLIGFVLSVQARSKPRDSQ